MNKTLFLFTVVSLLSPYTHLLSVTPHNLSIHTQQLNPDVYEPFSGDFSRHLWSWSTHSGAIGAKELNYFITNLYNCPLYAQDYLPNTFADMIRFLQYGNDTYKNRAYVQQVIRLFTNKLKACHYLNPYAFSQLLDELPKLLERHCIKEKLFTVDLVQREVNQCIKKYTQRTSPQQTPQDAVNELSKEIVQALDAHTASAMSTSVQELHKTIQVLCEVSIAKLIWSAEDGDESWNCTKKISQQLTRLMELSILADADDLNDLFISLLERYCYFIELMAHDLSPDFYTAINDDLKKQVPILLDLEEQEPSIDTKLNRFKRTLAAAEPISIKAHAQQQLQMNAQNLAQEHGIFMGKEKKIKA